MQVFKKKGLHHIRPSSSSFSSSSSYLRKSNSNLVTSGCSKPNLANYSYFAFPLLSTTSPTVSTARHFTLGRSISPGDQKRLSIARKSRHCYYCSCYNNFTSSSSPLLSTRRNMATSASPAGGKGLTIQSRYKMRSGYEIPVLGFGVYKTPEEECEQVVAHALKNGYRHVDSAVFYFNEVPCAKALVGSGIAREQLFFTSKIPPGTKGYDEAKKVIDETMAKIGSLGYVDLYLIHAPLGSKEARLGVWRALVEAVGAGKIRSIGVSNYGVHHLEELEAYIQELEAQHGKGQGGIISVNQCELHPWLARDDIANWCAQRGILMEAYSPLVRGQRNDSSLLKPICARTGKTAAQVLLRWNLQKGFIPLPKSVTPSRIEENTGIYDFELTQEEMESLNTGEYSPCAWDPTVSTDGMIDSKYMSFVTSGATK